MAEFETEVRGERVRAGIDAAREAGKKIGGGKAGRRIRLTTEKEKAIRTLHKAGQSPSAIAKTVGLSRPTVYAVLKAK